MAQGKERAAAANERSGARTDRHGNPDTDTRKDTRPDARTDPRSHPEEPERPTPGPSGAPGSGADAHAAGAAPRAAEEPATREERIRQAAYRRYTERTERGGAGGNDVDDWLAAEAEDARPPTST